MEKESVHWREDWKVDQKVATKGVEKADVMEEQSVDHLVDWKDGRSAVVLELLKAALLVHLLALLMVLQWAQLKGCLKAPQKVHQKDEQKVHLRAFQMAPATALQKVVHLAPKLVYLTAEE